jgi:5-formyltetrahydrofolate cyclo-ligase
MTNDDRNAVAKAAKSELRRGARVRVASMTRNERTVADAAVCAGLSELAGRCAASFVVAYLALEDEVDVEAFLSRAAGRGLPTLVPRVTAPGKIGLATWSPDCRLTPDGEGVPSPELPAEWPSGPGLLVVPGRVFDTEGGRVGRGLGYYDRFLGTLAAAVAVAGAAYECQIVDRVPREPHDAGVGWIVTETGCRRCGPALTFE